MSHHGDKPMSDVLRKILGTPEDLGPTGEYPRGKLNDDDEGEIKVAIAADPKEGVVIIDFGKPVAWIAFSPDQAREIADMLVKKAWQCRGIT